MTNDPPEAIEVELVGFTGTAPTAIALGSSLYSSVAPVAISVPVIAFTDALPVARPFGPSGNALADEGLGILTDEGGNTLTIES